MKDAAADVMVKGGKTVGNWGGSIAMVTEGAALAAGAAGWGHAAVVLEGAAQVSGKVGSVGYAAASAGHLLRGEHDSALVYGGLAGLGAVGSSSGHLAGKLIQRTAKLGGSTAVDKAIFRAYQVGLEYASSLLGSSYEQEQSR